MKTIKTNFIFLISLLFAHAIQALNLTMQMTNSTGYPCKFTDLSTNTVVTFNIGETKNYTFQSSPVSYSFGPSVPAYTPVFANGNINYNTNNFLYLSSNSQPYYINSTDFQLYLRYTNNNIIVLNKGASVAQGTAVSTIGAQLFSSGSVSTVPSIVTFKLDNTGAVTQTIIDLTNNSDNPSTNLTYYNIHYATLESGEIPAQGTLPIPVGAVYYTCFNNTISSEYPIQGPVSSNYSSKQFTNGSIINTTSSAVYCHYDGTINGNNTLLGSTSLIDFNQSKPIITGTESIAVYYNSTNKQLVAKAVDPNLTWYITYTNEVWDLTSTPPANTATITNNTGYPCNLVEGSKITTFANGETKIYTFSSNLVSYTFGPNQLTYTNSSSIPAGSIYTQYNSSISNYVYYISYHEEYPINEYLNATNLQIKVVDINENQYLVNKNQLVTTTSSINTINTQPYTSTQNSTAPLTAIFTLNPTTGAVDINATYATHTLTNNFNQPTATISFLNNTTETIASLNSLNAWSSTTIPTNTASIFCTGLANGGICTLNANTSKNIYTDTIITNNTNSIISITSTIPDTPGGSYTIYPGQSLPLITDTTEVTIFVDNILQAFSTILPDTSYIINYTDPNYTITPYTPELTNNYTTSAYFLSFYNSQNIQVLSLPADEPLPSGQSYSIPTTSSFATFTLSDDISIYTTFTIPITYPETSITTGNTITNSSGYNVQVNYYGNYNNLHDVLVTSSPIPMFNGQSIPITTGALNAQILNESGTEVIAEINGALHQGVDYYIIYNAGTWTLSSTPPGSTYYLINNFNAATETITFYNSSSQITGTIDSIPAYGSCPIPATTTKISCTGLINNSSCNIEITGNANVNIYSDYALTNNTDYDIVATYYGLVTSTIVTNGTVTIPARTSAAQPTFVPIITSTTKISVAQGSSTVIPQQTIVNNSSYIVNFDNPFWSLNTYTPTIYNNGSENGTDLTFYDVTGSAIPSTISGSFSVSSGAAIPVNATFVGVSIYESNLLIPVTLAATSYLFTQNNFTNLANQTVNITFYGTTVDGTSPTLNNPGIALQATQNRPRITTGTSVLVSAGDIIAIPQTSIQDNTSYFINYDAQTNTWWLSINAPAQNELLTNNYTQNATNLQFYTSDSNQTGSQIDSFEAWSSTSIPSNASFAKLTDLNTNIQLYTTPTIPVNMFTGFVIKNNTTQDIALWFYDTNNNHIQLNPGILTEPNISTPILTYTNTVAVTNAIYVDGIPTEVYIPATTISSNNSYYVIYDQPTDTWSLVATLPTENTYLTNNYDGIAYNLAFFNTNNTQQGTTLPSMASHTSTLIPTTSTTAEFSYFNSAIKIQIDDMTSTGIFTNNYVINNAGQTISAVYYDSTQTAISEPLLTIYTSNNIPIITSAAYFSILDSNGVEQITLQPIAVNTDYIIDNTWTVTPTTPARLTNNSGQDATNLNFYNGNTPVGITTSTFYNQTAADIPTGATKATTNEIFNTITSTLTVAADDSTNSNLVTNYHLNNNSGNTVTVIFKGTINNSANQPLNDPAISMPGFSFIAITTGTQTVSVYLGNVEVITDATINPNTTYYINYINNSWSIDTYASIVNLTNNSTIDATNLLFYDKNTTLIATDDNFSSYTFEPIPTTATYASADFQTPFDSTLTIPVTGAATCHFFNTSNLTIENNTNAVVQNVGLIFYGTINETSNVTLNDPTIILEPAQSLPILSGPETFSVVDPIDNSIIYIANYPIDANESYSITNYYDINNNLIWTINETQFTGVLCNNYNQEGTDLKFFNSTTTFDTSTQVGATQPSFPAYSSVGIPTNSLVSQFSVLNTTLTFPVSVGTSSTVYANILYNKTSETISVTYYGTLDGINNRALNNPAIICNSGESIPFLTATDYMIITSGSNTLDTRTTAYNPLPKTLAYDIVYNPSLNITPHQLHLTNNFYQVASSISFYSVTGTFISASNNIQPFATIAIPSSPQATSAVIVYEDYTLTIPLSTSNSSNVLTHNILTNNANDDVTIIFSDKQGNNLNTEPIALVTGSFIPLITGTEKITVLVNDTVIISNQTIIPTESYRLQQQNNFQQRLVRAADDNPELSPTSSALGVIRMLGGSNQTKPGLLPVEVYGNNINLFKEFLYIDIYAQIITDLTARAATIVAVNTIVDTYAQNNSSNNFNYVSYLYQINDQLRIAQGLLRSQYPDSIQEIDQFFRYTLKRNNTTLIN